MMLQIHSIYQDRLKQFTDGGQYRGQGLLAYVEVFDSISIDD